MTKITRKDFIGLSAAAVTSAVFGKSTSTHAMQVTAATGSAPRRVLTVGKRADLALLRTDRIGFAMQGSLADRVLNFASLSDVDSVWVAGQARKRNGQMIGVDWSRLKSQVQETQKRIRLLAASTTFT